MVDTRKTKSFTSSMTGAPVLTGTAGALIAVLDAVLVNGFSLMTASSLVVTDGIASVAFAAAHGHTAGSVALVGGATPAALNGEQRVLTATTLGYTFATSAPDGTATGTITSKVAPAGWAKIFSGTNLAAYKMGGVEGTGFVLRVDDTGTTTARLRAYESMTDVNTGTGPFPSVAQIAAPGLWVSKSNSIAPARPWRIVADERGFYYFVKNGDTASEHQASYFGDIVSLKSNDPYACVLRANTLDASGVFTPLGHELTYNDALSTYGGLYIARAANTLGGAIQAFNCAVMLPVQGAHAPGTVGYPYPSPIDNGLMLTPVMVVNSSGVRGYFPGISFPVQSVNWSFSTGDRIAGSGDMVGKTLTVVKTGAPSSPASQASVFIDQISDWRA